MRSFFGCISSLFLIPIYIGGFLGWAYWMWISVQLGSFLMFVIGLLGPLAIPASFLGLWSFLFGAPHWLLKMFS